MSQYSSVRHPITARQQLGASVSGIVFFILAMGIFVKLGLAIVPAQIGDYQFDKAVAMQLKKANDNGESSREFMSNLQKQLSVNADYNTKPEEILIFNNDKTGSLAVHKDYEVVNNFFGNVDIVNRFEGDITADDAAE